MASTSCFLHHHALSTNTTRSPSQRQVSNIKPTTQLVIRASHKNSVDDENNAVFVSRRFALSVLFGAAAVGSKVSPADAAYGEAGNFIIQP